MIISAKAVLRPRAERRCPVCAERIAGPLVDMFGAAERGNRPFHLYVHPRCAGTGETDDERRKIEAALEIIAAAEAIRTA
jgi:hypothetical protein